MRGGRGTGVTVPGDQRSRCRDVRRYPGDRTAQETADRVGEQLLGGARIRRQGVGEHRLGFGVHAGEHLPGPGRAPGRLGQRGAQGERVQSVDDADPCLGRDADRGEDLDAELVVPDQHVPRHELQQDRRRVAVAQHRPAERQADPDEPVDPGPAGVRSRDPALQHDGPRDRAQDVGPVPEVVVQRGRLDVELTSYPGQAERVEALAVDDAQRRLDHGIVADQRTGRTGHSLIIPAAPGRRARGGQT